MFGGKKFRIAECRTKSAFFQSKIRIAWESHYRRRGSSITHNTSSLRSRCAARWVLCKLTDTSSLACGARTQEPRVSTSDAAGAQIPIDRSSKDWLLATYGLGALSRTSIIIYREHEISDACYYWMCLLPRITLINFNQFHFILLFIVSTDMTFCAERNMGKTSSQQKFKKKRKWKKFFPGRVSQLYNTFIRETQNWTTDKNESYDISTERRLQRKRIVKKVSFYLLIQLSGE
jgi:hypothetical protein